MTSSIWCVPMSESVTSSHLTVLNFIAVTTTNRSGVKALLDALHDGLFQLRADGRLLGCSHEVDYSWKLKASEKMKSFKTTVAILFFVYGMGTFFYELVAIAHSVQDVDAWLPP